MSGLQRVRLGLAGIIALLLLAAFDLPVLRAFMPAVAADGAAAAVAGISLSLLITSRVMERGNPFAFTLIASAMVASIYRLGRVLIGLGLVSPTEGNLDPLVWVTTLVIFGGPFLDFMAWAGKPRHASSKAKAPDLNEPRESR